MLLILGVIVFVAAFTAVVKLEDLKGKYTHREYEEHTYPNSWDEDGVPNGWGHRTEEHEFLGPVGITIVCLQLVCSLIAALAFFPTLMVVVPITQIVGPPIVKVVQALWNMMLVLGIGIIILLVVFGVVRGIISFIKAFFEEL